LIVKNDARMEELREAHRWVGSAGSRHGPSPIQDLSIWEEWVGQLTSGHTPLQLLFV